MFICTCCLKHCAKRRVKLIKEKRQVYYIRAVARWLSSLAYHFGSFIIFSTYSESVLCLTD